MNFNMFVPTNALFGQGILNELHKQAMPGKKALLVISNGKATRENGYLERVEKELKLANIDYAIFDEIEPNPLKDTVMRGGKAARNHQVDFIVALGGGSVMDASKAIAMVASNDGDLWDYVQMGTGKKIPMKNKPLPLVAITTTAGTGSETDPGGVITNPETHEKVGVVFSDLFPVLAIIDPELMASVPPAFTAYQGFDALFHSTEGYINKSANLMSDMVSATAIENVAHYLGKVVNNGKDMEARERVAFGNYLSGISMCVGGCTSEHSLEHAMSAYHQELPHGAGLIMISKAYYTHFINKHVCDERFIEMAKLFGRKDAKEPMDFIIALSELQEECGVHNLKMSDYGIQESEFETLAKNAMDSMGGLFNNDRSPLSLEDCINIYKDSYR